MKTLYTQPANRPHIWLPALLITVSIFVATVSAIAADAKSVIAFPAFAAQSQRFPHTPRVACTPLSFHNNEAWFKAGFLFGIHRRTDGSSPLVNLLTFAGKRTDKGHEIFWEAAAEDRLKEYRVEWSADTRNWQSIYTVKAKNTAGKNGYACLHKAVAATNYYRLRLVDEDGFERHSQTIKLSEGAVKFLTAYPNPVADKLILSLPVSGPAFVRLVHSSGNVVIEKTVQASTETIDVSRMQVGVYRLVVMQGTDSYNMVLYKQ